MPPQPLEQHAAVPPGLREAGPELGRALERGERLLERAGLLEAHALAEQLDRPALRLVEPGPPEEPRDDAGGRESGEEEPAPTARIARAGEAPAQCDAEGRAADVRHVGDLHHLRLGQDDAQHHPAPQQVGRPRVEDAGLVPLPAVGGPEQPEEAVHHPGETEARTRERPLRRVGARGQEQDQQGRAGRAPDGLHRAPELPPHEHVEEQVHRGRVQQDARQQRPRAPRPHAGIRHQVGHIGARQREAGQQRRDHQDGDRGAGLPGRAAQGAEDRLGRHEPILGRLGQRLERPEYPPPGTVEPLRPEERDSGLGGPLGGLCSAPPDRFVPAPGRVWTGGGPRSTLPRPTRGRSSIG